MFGICSALEFGLAVATAAPRSYKIASHISRCMYYFRSPHLILGSCAPVGDVLLPTAV